MTIDPTDPRAAALTEVETRSKHLEAVRALAEEALNTATEDRLEAIRKAMRIAPTKDVAAASGISVQRLHQILKTSK